MLKILHSMSLMAKEKSGIGDRLREIRLKKNLNQEAFAQLVDSSKSSISGYELEDVPVPADILKNIAEKCGVSADWLLFGIEPDVPKDEKEKYLLKKYREAEKYHQDTEIIRHADWRVAEGKAKYGKEEGVIPRKSKAARDKAG